MDALCWPAGAEDLRVETSGRESPARAHSISPPLCPFSLLATKDDEKNTITTVGSEKVL